MKKIVRIVAAAMLVLSLAGCGASGKGNIVTPKNGYAEGHFGDIMKTYFFNFSVNSAYTCKEFEGYTPTNGYKVLVAEVTIKNTGRSTITMFDTDFQIQWGEDDDAYDAPITYYTDTVSEEQLPEEYELAINEERTGLLVFEVPENCKDYAIAYLEEFSDDTEGDLFFVYFSAKDK